MRLRYASISIIAVLAFILISCSGGGEQSSPVSPTYPEGKPTGVEVTEGSRSATLSWDAVSGASGYLVYISENGQTFRRYRGEPIETTVFTVLELTNDEIYYLGVSAVGVGGWESSIAYPGGSPTAIAVKPHEPEAPVNPEVGVPPLPPTDLQGEAKDATANIYWNPSYSGDFAYYRIYQKQFAGYSIGFGLLRDRYPSTDFTQSDLINGDSYAYYVTAVDIEELESVKSNTIILTPLDLAPEQLKNLDIFINPGRVLLEWQIPTEPDIVSYSVERVESIDPKTGGEVIVRFVLPKPTDATEGDPDLYAFGLVKVWLDLARDRTIVQDMAVERNKTYTYRISAIDEADQEGPVAVIVTPFPIP